VIVVPVTLFQGPDDTNFFENNLCYYVLWDEQDLMGVPPEAMDTLRTFCRCALTATAFDALSLYFPFVVVLRVELHGF
jgi:hypothetical protein